MKLSAVQFMLNNHTVSGPSPLPAPLSQTAPHPQHCSLHLTVVTAALCAPEGLRYGESASCYSYQDKLVVGNNNKSKINS